MPDEIIPNPEPGQHCNVMFKKTGMMAKDQNVYMDCDTDKKWLLMDKEGGFWSNPTYVLENFVREEGSKRGECLCAAKLEVTKVHTYGFDVHEDSDSSDSDDSDLDDNVEERVTKTKMKWAQKVKVKFYSDRNRDDKIAEVKVKAKGKGKKTDREIITTVEDKDDEGNVTGTHEETRHDIDIDIKLKKVKYVIEEMKGEDEPPKIKLKGKPDKSVYKLDWKGDVFQAEIDSNGFGADKIEVKTSWKNPALGMLMGYIIAKDISPDDIKSKVRIW